MILRVQCIDYYYFTFSIYSRLSLKVEKSEMYMPAKEDYWVSLTHVQFSVSMETKQRKFAKLSLENK